MSEFPALNRTDQMELAIQAFKLIMFKKNTTFCNENYSVTVKKNTITKNTMLPCKMVYKLFLIAVSVYWELLNKLCAVQYVLCSV